MASASGLSPHVDPPFRLEVSWYWRLPYTNQRLITETRAHKDGTGQQGPSVAKTLILYSCSARTRFESQVYSMNSNTDLAKFYWRPGCNKLVFWAVLQNVERTIKCNKLKRARSKNTEPILRHILSYQIGMRALVDWWSAYVWGWCVDRFVGRHERAWVFFFWRSAASC